MFPFPCGSSLVLGGTVSAGQSRPPNNAGEEPSRGEDVKIEIFMGKGSTTCGGRRSGPVFTRRKPDEYVTSREDRKKGKLKSSP